MLWRTCRRSIKILQDDGLLELLRKSHQHIHLRKRIYRHPYFLSLISMYIRRLHRHLPKKYTDAKPFKIIYVNPGKIEYSVENINTGWGTVVGGCWDRTKFNSNHRYRILRQRFINKKSWSQLPISSELGEQKERLYKRIRDCGYKTQLELEPERFIFSIRDTEIGVGIDRDGTIVHIGKGQHRLSIAKLLKLEQVPVQVRVRHTDWQYIRDEIRTTDDKSELSERAKSAIGHPDLEDLLEDKDWE